jgi:hypothetical protein
MIDIAAILPRWSSTSDAGEAIEIGALRPSGKGPMAAVSPGLLNGISWVAVGKAQSVPASPRYLLIVACLLRVPARFEPFAGTRT